MVDQQTPAGTGQPAGAPPVSVGFGVTALVLGIVGVFLFWIPFFGLILPILAVIFGCIGIYRQSGRGMAVAGLVIGIISFALSLGLWMFAVHRAATGS